MTSPRLLQIAILALVTYGMSAATGLAQTTPPTVAAIPGVTPDKPDTVPEDAGPRMDFRFDGLPLTETIKGIQEQYHKAAPKKHLNVVMGEHLRELAETNIVTLDVKQVTVGELFKLIGTSSQRGVSWVALNKGGGYTQQTGKGGFSFVPVPSSGGNPTYLLQSEYPSDYTGWLPGPNPQQQDRKYVSYFSLEPYLDHFKIEDITTAMKLGWELSGAKELPTMKFHEETKLLVVSGTQEQLTVVTQVLQNLATSAGTGAPNRLPPPPASRTAIPVSPAKP